MWQRRTVTQLLHQIPRSGTNDAFFKKNTPPYGPTPTDVYDLIPLKFHVVITSSWIQLQKSSVFCSVSRGTSEAPIQQCLATVSTRSNTDGLWTWVEVAGTLSYCWGLKEGFSRVFQCSEIQDTSGRFSLMKTGQGWEERLRELGLFGLEKEGSVRILPKCVNTWWG